MDWQALFPWLLFLHVLAAIVAFGPTFAFATIGGLGGKEPQHANFATRVSSTISSRLVYPIGITLPITGAAMILVLGIDLSSRAYLWLDIAIVIYIVAYGYSFFVQRPIVDRIIEMTSTPPPPGATGPPPELMRLVKQVQRGGMVLGILVVVIVFLMVVKPQF
jgi:uncharacterized membrane protein